MSKPFEDLLKDSSESFENGNYFLVTITDLELGTSYPIQFKWKYKDGSLGKDWSAAYNLLTPIRTNPSDPALPVENVVGGAGFIKVTWNGNDASGNPLQNIDRVDVHISGSSFGDGTKPSGSFKIAGTQTFTAEPGVYIVQLRAVTVNGATSFLSTARTVTVTAIGEVVQTPTLPSGLSVATAPFAVTVNWAGTYSSGTFTGFKSIDIYAVSSDLGASATSGITNTNLVGSLTVNNTPNKINISLDNLRQALGLTNNSDVYNATIFYYFNATNRDGTKFGSPTYTRINSSSVVPTKANFIDLASGVISIENLVAGNGTFSSWLRTGTAGGARIELSAVSDFVNGGNTVQKGLVAYSSGNTEIFNLDIDAGTLTINGSGTFTGDLTAGSGNSIFKSDSNGIYLGNAVFASAPFSVSRSGVIKAQSGTIGGLILSANSLTNSVGTFSLDSGGKARFGSSSGNAIIIDPAAGVGSAYIYHSSNGGASASGKFTVQTDGTLVATGVNISGTITANALDTTSLDISSAGAITTSSGNFSVTSGGILSATGASISGTLTATAGSIGGWTVGSTAISSPNISGTGGDGGGIRLNSSSNIFEFLYNSLVVGSFYTTNSGNEIILQRGANGITSFRYPTSTGFISLNANGGTFGRNAASGLLAMGISVDSTSISITTSTGGITTSGGPFYTGANTTIATDQSEGISLTQGGTISARRNNANPLNLHRYNVTAANTTSVSVIDFFRNGTARGTLEIFGNTSAPVLVGSSDYRLKENIRDFDNSLNKLLQTKVRVFNEIEDENKNDIVGFVAHEFAEVFPDYVTGEKDAVDEDGNPVYQKLSYTNLVPYLVGAIQELSRRLDALEG